MRPRKITLKIHYGTNDLQKAEEVGPFIPGEHMELDGPDKDDDDNPEEDGNSLRGMRHPKLHRRKKMLCRCRTLASDSP